MEPSRGMGFQLTKTLPLGPGLKGASRGSIAPRLRSWGWSGGARIMEFSLEFSITRVALEETQGWVNYTGPYGWPRKMELFLEVWVVQWFWRRRKARVWEEKQTDRQTSRETGWDGNSSLDEGLTAREQGMGASCPGKEWSTIWLESKLQMG